MGIENLGNNDFGKLQLTNLNNAKAQKNSKDLANEQIKKEELKNINLNQGVLQAGQTDLTQAYLFDDGMAKGEDNSEQPTTKIGFTLVDLGLAIYEIVKLVKTVKDAKAQLGKQTNLDGEGGVLQTDAPPLTPVFGPGGAFGAGVTGGGLN